MNTNYFIYENKGLNILVDMLNVAIGIFVIMILLKLIINSFSYIFKVSKGIFSDLFNGINSIRLKDKVCENRKNREPIFKKNLEFNNKNKAEDLNIRVKEPIIKEKS